MGREDLRDIVNDNLEIRLLSSSDIDQMSDAFSEVELYDQYLDEQNSGKRTVFIAVLDREITGYLTIVWESEYLPFREKDIPEIKDLRILPRFRRRKIATRLLDRAERIAVAKSDLVGIGVGLYSFYGPAQRLYILRGYVPDGKGLSYNNVPVKPGESVKVDDNLTLQLVKPLK